MGHRRRNRRAGFTMVELLSSIAIMTLMMTLLIGASYRFIANAKEAATATTVMKASGIIDDRVRAFREFNFTDAAFSAAAEWNYVNSNSNYNNYSWNCADNTFTLTGDTVNANLAEILLRKTRFKRAFPQAFAEMDAGMRDRYFGAGVVLPPASATYNSKYESGIVLYALLMKGETFGAPTPGDDTFTSAEVLNSVQTGGLPCLVDAWGEPLRFYRWPTRLIRCGEQDFDGNGTYDDYNQNGVQDPAGWVDVGVNKVTFSPAMRPYPSYNSPTPASLLMASSLAPFDRRVTTTYSKGYDLGPGVAGIDDDGLNGLDDPGEIGWPGTDDPERLNTDPDDPTFRLAGWLFDTNLSQAQQQLRRSVFVNNQVIAGQSLTNVTGNPQQYGFHDFYTFHTPLVVSAGPDKNLGLYEPWDLTNFGYLAAPTLPPSGTSFYVGTMQYLYDDITNLNQRAGGR